MAWKVINININIDIIVIIIIDGRACLWAPLWAPTAVRAMDPRKASPGWKRRLASPGEGGGGSQEPGGIQYLHHTYVYT
jgi:hypothetical protein